MTHARILRFCAAAVLVLVPAQAVATEFVIVTHNDKLSAQADRIIHIQDGQII